MPILSPREVTEIKKEMCVKQMEIQIIHFRRQSYIHQDQRKNQAHDTMIFLWTADTITEE